jgi:hypothetical protein
MYHSRADAEWVNGKALVAQNSMDLEISFPIQVGHHRNKTLNRRRTPLNRGPSLLLMVNLYVVFCIAGCQGWTEADQAARIRLMRKPSEPFMLPIHGPVLCHHNSIVETMEVDLIERHFSPCQSSHLAVVSKLPGVE